MKINEKILSIPPYISTTWSNVIALHMKDADLVVSLLNGDNLVVPDLNKEVIETIFLTHSLYLDRTAIPEQLPSMGALKNMPHGLPNFFDMNMESHILPFKIGDTSHDSIEEIGSMLSHNPAQANAPELPPEVLSKIVAITKIVSPDAPISLPKAETGCNCMHCQISRAIHHNQEVDHPEIGKEEEVTVEDLTFRQWDICQTGNKLYTVINRLDTKEKYSVYLGQPLGCTCGKPNCEHLLAVLKS